MLRIALVLVAAGTLAASVAAAVATPPQTSGRAEPVAKTQTVIVSSRSEDTAWTTFEHPGFGVHHKYRITVSGTVSLWCPPTATSAVQCTSGSPLLVGEGVDALYCYAKWACKKPWLSHQLQITGFGWLENMVSPSTIPYQRSHRYTIVIDSIQFRPPDRPDGRWLGFFFSESSGNLLDNSGSFRVKVEDLGSTEPVSRALWAASVLYGWADEDAATVALLQVGKGKRATYRLSSVKADSAGLSAYKATAKGKTATLTELRGKLTLTAVYHRAGAAGSPPQPATRVRRMTFDVLPTGGRISIDSDGHPTLSMRLHLGGDTFFACDDNGSYRLQLVDGSQPNGGGDVVNLNYSSKSCAWGGALQKPWGKWKQNVRVVIRNRKA